MSDPVRLLDRNAPRFRWLAHWWSRNVHGYDVQYLDEMGESSREYMRRTSEPSICWVCGEPAGYETIYPTSDSGYTPKQTTCGKHWRMFREGRADVRVGCLVCGGEWTEVERAQGKAYNPDCRRCVTNHSESLKVVHRRWPSGEMV